MKEPWRCLLPRLPPRDRCRAFRVWGFTSTFHNRIQAPLPSEYPPLPTPRLILRPVGYLTTISHDFSPNSTCAGIGPAARGAWNLMRLATIRCHPSPPQLRSAFCRCMRLWPREKLRRCKCGSTCTRRFHRRMDWTAKANPFPPRSGLRGQSATSSDQGARRGSRRTIRSGTLPTLGQGRTKQRRMAKIQSGRAYRTNTGSPASSHDFPRFPRGIAIDRAQVSTA